MYKHSTETLPSIKKCFSIILNFYVYEAFNLLQ